MAHTMQLATNNIVKRRVGGLLLFVVSISAHFLDGNQPCEICLVGHYLISEQEGL